MYSLGRQRVDGSEVLRKEEEERAAKGRAILEIRRKGRPRKGAVTLLLPPTGLIFLRRGS